MVRPRAQIAVATEQLDCTFLRPCFGSDFNKILPSDNLNGFRGFFAFISGKTRPETQHASSIDVPGCPKEATRYSFRYSPRGLLKMIAVSY